MAISFKRVPEVAKGDPVTSRQLAALANGFNERLRSGLCEPWRIFFWIYSMFRSIRNEAADGLTFPSQAEFFEIYQLIDPSEAEWPTEGPGEFEGTNLASVMGGYVFGVGPVASEDERLTGSEGMPMRLDGDNPTTPEQLWNLGKVQRGAYDPETGSAGSPSFTAARSFFRLIQGPRSPHNNSYGGFMPTPEVLGDCGDGTIDTPPTLNYRYFFTKLDPDAPCPPGTTPSGNTCYYNGSCPAVSGDVLAIYSLPWAYYVYRVGQDVPDIVDPTKFLLGPFSFGSTLRKVYGGHIQRVLNAFAREFRGSDSQREDPVYYLEHSFPFQKFITSQYHLAPNVGMENGSGGIDYIYPLFQFPSVAASSAAPANHVQSAGPSFGYRSGTVLASFFVSGTNVFAPVTITAMDGAKTIETVVVEPDADGKVAKLVTLETPVTPAALQFRLGSELRYVTGAGTLQVECTQLYEYKPNVHDWALLLRAAGADWTSTRADGRGIDEHLAKEIGEAYFANGCITNIKGFDGLPGQTVAVNTNAVFDTARRLSMFTRCVSRRQLRGYAVEGGKSVLWFARYAYGLSSDTTADIFQGIAPARRQVEVGEIKAGYIYIVRKGTITYEGNNYAVGMKFTGLRGKTDFTRADNFDELYEYEGMFPIAPEKGYTNAWLMGVQFKGYHTSETSIWKPDSYGDIFALSNRCLFASAEVAGFYDLNWHYSFGDNRIFSPEAPSSYNYVHGVNGGAFGTPDRFKSCQIYEPEPEIESATIEIGDGGEEVVKLVFKTRFRHDPAAPASIDRDISTWNISDLDTEAPRYMENGIRQYLVWITTGRNLNHKEGDAGADTSIWHDPDGPFATILPHFIFTQLIPSPYVDVPADNDRQDRETDTPVVHDQMTMMELYLRVMCEGCVDGETSRSYACATGVETLFDYTFENLCFDAFGGRWIGTVDSEQRPDKPQGFGPIPNIEMRSEIFNQFAKCINKLDKFRVDLPIGVECKTRTYGVSTGVRIIDVDGGDAGDCSTVDVLHAWYKGTAPVASTLNFEEDWADCTSFIQATNDCELDGAGCLGANWKLDSGRVDSDFRVAFTNPDAIYAIPATWADMLDTNLGVLAIRTTHIQHNTMEVVASAGDGSPCCDVVDEPCPGFWSKSLGGFLKFDNPSEVIEECILLQSGSISAPPIGGIVVQAGRTAGGHNCFGGQGNIVAIEPVVQGGSFLTVPLVDP